MPRSVAMPKALPQGHTQRTPNGGLGSRRGEQLELVPRDSSSVAEHIDGLHRVLGEAVEEAGGTVWLAASMEKPHPEVSLRVRRAPDSKGVTQKATLDMVAHLATDLQARAVFLAGLCDLWGFEPPAPKRLTTVEERYQALMAEIEEANGMGKALIDRAAKRLRTDSGAFRR